LVNLNDPDLRMMHISGFPGGVNEFTNLSGLKPREPVTWLTRAINVNIRERSILTSREGQQTYLDKAYRHIQEPVRAMYRYRNSVNLKRIMFTSGDTLYADTDDGRADPITTIQGDAQFATWRDTALIGSTKSSLAVYDGSTYSPMALGPITVPIYHPGSTSSSGGTLINGWYYYRFTYDYYAGNTFLAESGATRPNGGTDFQDTKVDATGGSDDNQVEFKTAFFRADYLYPPLARTLNIYRRFSQTDVYYPTFDATGYQLITKLQISDLVGLPTDTLIFTDDGSLAPQDEIMLEPFWVTPRPTCMAWHKGRLWLASPDVKANDETSYTHYNDRVYMSRVGSNGPEPLAFHPELWEFVGRGDPFDITGMVSIHNEYLLVLKPDSCWMIYGGDDEVDGVPLINVKKVPGTIGCVSPRSIVETEIGVMWWDVAGPVVFDGSGPPRYLSAERIRKTARSISGGRMKDIVAATSKQDREVTWFYSIVDPIAPEEAFNDRYSRYNMESRTWVHGLVTMGVGAALAVDNETSDGYTLWGIADSPDLFSDPNPLVRNSLILRADIGGIDGIVETNFRSAAIGSVIESPLMDDGSPFTDKQFLAIQVECKTPTSIQVDYLVDNVFDSRNGDGFPLFPAVASDTGIWDSGTWDEVKWGIEISGFSAAKFKRASGTTIPVGKGISIILSWSNRSVPVEITSITVFYKTLGVRK
jgi:hypothetical protein